MTIIEKLSGLIILCLLFFAFIEAGEIYASSADDYLWIEFGEQVKEKNGSLTQPLSVYYGRFPDRREGASRLEDLKAYYTINGKDEKGEDVFYTAGIDKDENKDTKTTSIIKINSLETNHITVFVEGKRDFGRLRYNYLAKASFFLYGNSMFEKEKVRPVFPGNIIPRFHIDINQGYWPQTGAAFKGVFLFDKNPLAGDKIAIFDENENYVNIETDKEGKFIYIPPDDKRLRRKGVTAYKQIVLTGEQITGDTAYKSSYTLLLHRSRSGYRDLHLGGMMLGGTIAVIFIIVLVRRRNFQP